MNKDLTCFKSMLTFTLMLFCQASISGQDIEIIINAEQNVKKVSPYLYGRNLAFEEPAGFYKDVGLHFARMNAGNNATKYNWKRKISSHPDWYNNVYANDWDATSLEVTSVHKNIQLMWAFQLLGRVAANTNNNFNDWEYNNSQWWSGVHQNLAGGGTPNSDNPEGDALEEGDVNLYTMDWPADSTVAILEHWFGENGIGLNKDQFQYWSMDNEPDIWAGTHDDVMPDGQLPAADFMERYIEVAKKARALYPEIKICGPVVTNEWQWYNWGEEDLYVDGEYFSWLEYFIKAAADEEKASGIRVLDVVDIHNYPYSDNDASTLQFHRTYFDEDYEYPGANGVKTINGGWDNSQTREFIFKRVENWLDEHFGEGHGIKLALSEWATSSNDPNVRSLEYGSLLGTFANHGVEFFTPWFWEAGMWETLHLFSRYAKSTSISSVSSQENMVSAYSTINNANDSLTIILINRELNNPRNVNIDIEGFTVASGSHQKLVLSDLPTSETFVSHSENALISGSVQVSANKINTTLPPLSTTALLLTKSASTITSISDHSNNESMIKIFPNPSESKLNVRLSIDVQDEVEMEIRDISGKKIPVSFSQERQHNSFDFDVTSFADGVYFLTLKTGKEVFREKFVVSH